MRSILFAVASVAVVGSLESSAAASDTREMWTLAGSPPSVATMTNILGVAAQSQGFASGVALASGSRLHMRWSIGGTDLSILEQSTALNGGSIVPSPGVFALLFAAGLLGASRIRR